MFDAVNHVIIVLVVGNIDILRSFQRLRVAALHFQAEKRRKIGQRHMPKGGHMFSGLRGLKRQ